MKNVFLNGKVKYNLWFYFILFTFSNILLTYGSLSLVPKIWVLVAGLAMPFFLLINTQALPLAGENAAYFEESFPWPSIWIWFLLVVIALSLRFWGLNDPSSWFSDDEALMGLLAVDKLHHWQWKWFNVFSESPITPSFLSYPLFKVCHSPFFNLRLPTACISVLTIVAGYFASRRFCSQSTSIIFTFLIALSYWPVWIGRFTHPGSYIPLWELGVIWGLCNLVRADSPKSKKIWASFLGFNTGLGSLTYTSWFAMLPIVFLVLVWMVRKKSSGTFSWILLFIFSFLLSLFPLISYTLEKGFGRYIWAASVLSHPLDLIGLFRTIFGYLSVLFWGITEGICIPSSGGFLNIFLASFFFIGLAELWRFRKNNLAKWLVFSFLLFLLPGFLAVGVETMRVIPVLIPFLGITAVGIQSFLWYISKSHRIFFLVILLLLSLCLDTDRLFQIHQHLLAPESVVNNSPYYQSFKVLSQFASEKGPGFVFPELIPETGDDSLTYSTYSLNADWNKQIPLKEINWIGIFTSSHYVSDLSNQFPQSEWIGFPLGTAPSSSKYVLALIPLTDQIRPVIKNWLDFYHAWTRINFSIRELVNWQLRKDILQDMILFYPSIPKDPFLQSCFFEKLAFNYSWEKTFHPEDTWTNWNNFSGLFEQSFEKGYQDVVLCEKFGRLLMVDGKYTEARRTFEKALQQNPKNEFLKYEIRQAVSSAKTKNL